MAKEKKCQAVTSDGDSCNNKAVFPEDNPVACHIKAHQEQMMEKLENEDDDLPEENKKELETHIFASDKLVHTVFVDTDKETEPGERDYFRVQFRGGKWETDNDKKAELLQKAIDKNRALKRSIKKIQ